MKLSTRSTYGMRALVEIGLAKGRGPMSAASIAIRQGLSVAYLEQLLHRLKKRGLVHSIRGPKGGYLLAKDPERITVSQIVDTLEGPASLVRDGARASQRPLRSERAKAPLAKEGPPLSANGKDKPPHRVAHRAAQTVVQRVQEHLAHSLDQLTLKDLCEDVRETPEDPLEHRYVFHI